MLPDPDEVEALILRQLGSTALFAARFREAAGRALLLPAPASGRARAALAAAQARRRSAVGRGALRLVPDHPRDLPRVPARRVRSAGARRRAAPHPQPLAARRDRSIRGRRRRLPPSLLFNYVANYIYDGDAPLAERRAQALAVDQSQLRELIGDAELRDLLDTGAIETVEAELQHLPERFHAKSTDARARSAAAHRRSDARRDRRARASPDVAEPADRRRCSRRGAPIELTIAGEPRLVAVEHAARYRDALGTPLPAGLARGAARAGRPTRSAIWSSATRGRTGRSPRRRRDRGSASRSRRSKPTLARLTATGPHRRRRVSAGRTRPRVVRRRRAAQHPPPIAGAAAAGGRAGRGAGARPISHRLARHRPHARRARRAARHHRAAAGRAARRLAPRARDPAGAARRLLARAARHAARRRRSVVGRRRAARRSRRPHRALPHRSPAAAVAAGRTRHAGADRTASPRCWHSCATAARRSSRRCTPSLGGGFPQETVDALWSLVWKGLVTNDTLHALRAYLRPPERARRPAARTPFRSRRLVPPIGRRPLDRDRRRRRSRSLTEWATAVCAAAAHAPRRRHARGHGDRADPRRLQHGLSGAAAAGGDRARAPRLLRRRPRRGAVRAAGRGRSAARRARGARRRRWRSRSPRPTRPIPTARCCRGRSGRRRRRRRRATAGSAARARQRSAGARVILVDGRLTAWIARGDRHAAASRCPPTSPIARASAARWRASSSRSRIARPKAAAAG